MWSPFGFILALSVYISLMVIVQIIDNPNIKFSTKMLIFVALFLLFKFSMIYNTESMYNYSTTSEYFVKKSIMYTNWKSIQANP